MKERLLAIGEALIDFIPDQTGISFEEVTAFSPKVGGAPANVCGAYAALGKKASLLTALGKDGFGGKIEKELALFGVDTSQIVFTDKAKTALAFVSLAPDGNRAFSFYRNPSADMLYAPTDISPSAFDDAFALHFCSVSLGDFPMKEAHKKAISLAKEAGALVSFDPNLRFPLWNSKEALYDAVWEFLPSADILKISDEELSFITRSDDWQEALDLLLVGRVKLLLYTRGKNGASLFLKRSDGSVRSFDACGISANTVDTTGAGDAFIGAFLYSLSLLGATPDTLADLSEEALLASLAFANRFAAYSTEHYGALPSYRDAANRIDL